MGMIIETIIYLLACFGIIIITILVFNSIKYSNIWENTYTIFKDNDKRVDINIRLYNMSEHEKNIIIEKIKNGDYKNIEDITENIKVNTFDNK